jgi:sugar lactone lactonase YvrE
LYRVTPEGEVSVIPTGPSISLFAVTLDDEGTIYVVDTDNSNAYRIAEGGAKRLAPPERTDVFRGATTLDADHEGNLYIGENDANIVRKVTPDGRIEILAGTVGAGGSVDGMGADARFSRPRGLTVDPSGNVYVADEEDSVIRKITPQGMVTTVAGKAGASGDADGAGSEARFAAPKGLAADADGNVYVMDTENHTIRKLTPDGTVTTLAGKAGASGFVDGAAGEARFAGPRAGVVDKQGNLFVADDENGAVRMISPDGRVTTVVAAKPPSSN